MTHHSYNIKGTGEVLLIPSGPSLLNLKKKTIPLGFNMSFANEDDVVHNIIDYTE